MYNLDLSSPRGYGRYGNDGDATEHGTVCTFADLDRLCNSTGAYIKTISTPNGSYNLICIDATSSANTVILIAGGTQEVFCLDSSIGPNGFVMPLNLIEMWKEYGINIAIVVPTYAMPWGWWALASATKTNYISNKMVFVKKPTIAKTAIDSILRFQEDLHYLLTSFADQQCWLVGHCSSADMIARYYSTERVKKPRGMVLWNPPNYTWRATNEINNMDNLKYFFTDVLVPVLFVQHSQDTCPAAGNLVAEKLFNDCNSSEKELVILSGGDNQGCPNFSMGYHGFRGIEDMLVQATAKFINAY